MYMAISPEGDKRVFRQPDMKAMFIDDIVRANLIPDWDREFARAGEEQPGSTPSEKTRAGTPGRSKPNEKSVLGGREVPSKLPSKVPSSNNRSAS